MTAITSVLLSTSVGASATSTTGVTQVGGAHTSLARPQASFHNSALSPLWPLPPSSADLQASPWMPAVTPNPARAGVCLSPGSEPFPRKLVDRVQSGAYVDMKELLGDNISLLQQLEAMNMTATLPALPGSMKPRFREVTALASWLYCFLAYAALRCPDQESRDRLEYARLIIREAQRHGGQGWLDYDRVFRQQAALDPALRWNTLQPAIQASTLFNPIPAPASSNGPATNVGAFCSLCRGVDHSATSCALAYLQQPTSATANYHLPPRPARKRAAVASHSLCISWNRGRCIFPSTCTFRHVCSICFHPHPAIDCPSKANRPQPRSVVTAATSSS